VVSASDGHSADGCGSRKNSKEGAVVNHREKDIKKTWWKKRLLLFKRGSLPGGICKLAALSKRLCVIW
jgi:hypothetical protein